MTNASLSLADKLDNVEFRAYSTRLSAGIQVQTLQKLKALEGPQKMAHVSHLPRIWGSDLRHRSPQGRLVQAALAFV